jgi:hypothetical protein
MHVTRDRFQLFTIVFLSVSLMIGLGCKREAGRSVVELQVGTSLKLIEEMAPTDVIVSVNGVTLTRENYDDAMAVKETLYVLTRPGVTKQELNMSRPYWGRAVIQEFLARQVILQAALEKKHTTSAEALRVTRSEMIAVMKINEQDLERKFMELGRVGQSLKALMVENALIRSFREAEHGETLKVTPLEVENRILAIKAYHERAEATNQLVMAKGLTLYEQLKKGDDFFKLAARYSEAADKPIGEWGTFLKGEVEHAKLREAAFALPVGAVSEPIDTEEGLVIIKVMERKEEAIGPAVAPGPATVTLGRIVLRMAEGGTGAKLPTREEVEKALTNEKVKALQQNWLPALVSKSSIAYPNGTNLWLNAKAKKSARPQRGLSRLETKEEPK